MLLVQGPGFENQCDRGGNPQPRELGGSGPAPGLKLLEKGSRRRRPDPKLQRLRGCSGLLEWTEEGEGGREVRVKGIFHSLICSLQNPPRRETSWVYLFIELRLKTSEVGFSRQHP